MANYYGVNDDSYLAHHGVKGMKWGVRKERKSSVSRSKKNRQKRQTEKTRLYPSEDYLKNLLKTTAMYETGEKKPDSRYIKSISNAIKGIDIQAAARGERRKERKRLRQIAKSSFKDAIANLEMKELDEMDKDEPDESTLDLIRSTRSLLIGGA